MADRWNRRERRTWEELDRSLLVLLLSVAVCVAPAAAAGVLDGGRVRGKVGDVGHRVGRVLVRRGSGAREKEKERERGRDRSKE